MISLNIPTYQVYEVNENDDAYLFEGKATLENGSPCPTCGQTSFNG